MSFGRAQAALLAITAALVAACGGSSGKGPAPAPAGAPTFSPAAPLNFRDSLEVALATTTSGATIRYTLDGAIPGAGSAAYTGPLTLTTTTVVKAYATGGGAGDSAVATATYTYRPVALVVDDGVDGADLRVYGGAAALIANRFTPDARDFPFELRTIRIKLGAWQALPIQVAVYADPDGLATGATLLDAHPLSTVAPPGAWTEYAVSPPLRLEGPGDLVIGVVGEAPPETGALSAGISCLADSTGAGRTFIGWWNAGTGAPAFPPGWSSALPVGTAMIRGSN